MFQTLYTWHLVLGFRYVPNTAHLAFALLTQHKTLDIRNIEHKDKPYPKP